MYVLPHTTHHLCYCQHPASEWRLSYSHWPCVHTSLSPGGHSFTLGCTLGVVHSVDLTNIMTCLHHRIDSIQNSFTARENPLALPIYPFLSLTLGNNQSFYSLHSFVFKLYFPSRRIICLMIQHPLWSIRAQKINIQRYNYQFLRYTRDRRAS